MYLDRDGLLICLIGPAGSGKTTLSQKLVQEFSPTVKHSISLTSRAPRTTEIDGVSYHFVTREVFLEKVKEEELFEWEETHGNFYGTLRGSLESAIQNGSDLTLDIDIRGALNFKRSFPQHTIIVFLIPPSPETLKERIVNRSVVSPEELERRIQTAKDEYKTFLSDQGGEHLIDYAVVNDDLEKTYDTVRSILLAERVRMERISSKALRKICTVE